MKTIWFTMFVSTRFGGRKAQSLDCIEIKGTETEEEIENMIKFHTQNWAIANIEYGFTRYDISDGKFSPATAANEIEKVEE